MSKQSRTLNFNKPQSLEDVEQMDEWKEIKLDNILEDLITGDRPSGGGLDDGDYISIGGTQIDSDGRIKLDDLAYINEDFFKNVSETQIERHDILMTKDGAKTGEVAIAWEDSPEMVTNEHVLTLRVKNRMNPPYVFYYLHSNEGWKQITGTITGSAQEGINMGFAGKINVNYPPISEQRRISSVLYNVDQAIQKTEEIIEQTRRVKKGLMQDLFTEGYYEHEKYENCYLGPIQLEKPKNWDLREFNEFSDKIQDGPHITPEYADSGIPFVSSQNVNPFRENFDYENYQKFVSEKTYTEINKNCRPKKGDLIISRRATIGPAQLIRQNKKFAFFVGVAIIKTDSSVYNPYLEQLLNWGLIKKMWHLKSPGSTMKTLNLGTIRQQKLPFPELEEQREIADALRSLDEKIVGNEKQLKQMKRIKKGLMQDLLTGKVRTKGKDIEVLDEVLEVEKS